MYYVITSIKQDPKTQVETVPSEQQLTVFSSELRVVSKVLGDALRRRPLEVLLGPVCKEPAVGHVIADEECFKKPSVFN